MIRDSFRRMKGDLSNQIDDDDDDDRMKVEKGKTNHWSTTHRLENLLKDRSRKRKKDPSEPKHGRNETSYHHCHKHIAIKNKPTNMPKEKPTSDTCFLWTMFMKKKFYWNLLSISFIASHGHKSNDQFDFMRLLGRIDAKNIEHEGSISMDQQFISYPNGQNIRDCMFRW